MPEIDLQRATLAIRYAAAAVLRTVRDAGDAGVRTDTLRIDLLTRGASDVHYGALVGAAIAHRYVTTDEACICRLTEGGAAYLDRIGQGGAPDPDEQCPAEWIPHYSPYRHGGWYVNNVRYPAGSVGGVSSNYEDHKWRIVCDPRRDDLGNAGDFTFRTRDAAARAEYELAKAEEKWLACGNDPVAFLLRLLAPDFTEPVAITTDEMTGPLPHAQGSGDVSAAGPEPVTLDERRTAQKGEVGYFLPQYPSRDWDGCKEPDFIPTPRQQLVIDAAKKALDAGMFYNQDFNRFVADVLGIDEATRNRNRDKTEDGDFGIDVYYARVAIKTQRKHAALVQVAEELNLKPNDQLHTLVFEDNKVSTSAVVLSVTNNGLSACVEVKRGPRTIRMERDALDIKEAVERAREKGKRKDGYPEFIASRRKGNSGPAEPQAGFSAPRQQQLFC